MPTYEKYCLNNQCPNLSSQAEELQNMTDKVMSYRIRYLILIDYPIQHVHKAWLQRGSSMASLQPGPSQCYIPPGTDARVRFMLLSLICAMLASGFVQDSRVQEHSRSAGGHQEVMGQGLWTSAGTEKHNCQLTWIIQVDLNNEECPLAQKVNKSLAHWTKIAKPLLRPGAASALGSTSAWREGQDALVQQALLSSLFSSKELTSSLSAPPCLQMPALLAQAPKCSVL